MSYKVSCKKAYVRDKDTADFVQTPNSALGAKMSRDRPPNNSPGAASPDPSVRERAVEMVQDRAAEGSGPLVPWEEFPAAEARALVVLALVL